MLLETEVKLVFKCIYLSIYHIHHIKEGGVSVTLDYSTILSQK